MRPWPGTPYPLGATYDGVGTNFTLFSEVADYVELNAPHDAMVSHPTPVPRPSMGRWTSR